MITPTTVFGAAQNATPDRTKESATTQAAARDRELVRRFRNGDENAFNEIVFHHCDRLMNVALSVLHNTHDAEEMVQSSFIRAYKHLHKFRGDSSLASWLYLITLNLSRNRYLYYLRRKRHKTFSIDVPPNSDTSNTFSDLIAEDAKGPHQECALNELEVLIDSCMKKISCRKREILRFRIDQGMRYTEIGVALGVNIGTVKSRLARARMSLLRKIALECPELAHREDVMEIVRNGNHRVGLARA